MRGEERGREREIESQFIETCNAQACIELRNRAVWYISGEGPMVRTVHILHQWKA